MTEHPRSDFFRETILRLRVGESAPRGYELLRVIGTYQGAARAGDVAREVEERRGCEV